MFRQTLQSQMKPSRRQVFSNILNVHIHILLACVVLCTHASFVGPRRKKKVPRANQDKLVDVRGPTMH